MYEQETEHETPHRPPVTRRNLLPAFLIALVSIATGIAIGLSIPWFPAQASTQAKKIDTLYYVLICFSVPVFVAVETVVLFSVYKFRMRPGEEELDGPPIHGNTRLEIVWTAVPSAIIAGLVVYAAVVLQEIDKKPAHEFQMQVYAQQFAWSFGYPNPTPGGHTIVSDDLYMVKGTPVDFRLHTSDVLHGFWIPAFRVQEDAVPGIITSLQATPTRLGTYDIICTELCGLGHSLMRSQVHVVTAAQYSAFLSKFVAAKTVPASTSPAAVASIGKTIFTGSAGCSSCHTLADANATGTVGPDLDKYLKGKTAAFIRTSIVDPNAYIEKGYNANIMPGNFNSTLSSDQINALVQYLVKVTAK
jgi:cytochrome c oxidase subunit 2